ncbi:probable G-protein coupled receptor 25 [Esox lucius]|uniref:G-protein coupled receptors family 1 profile domain-containing protein n=1 Tax=Esox lucius TaxID=8010 RepID=A0A3P8Z2W7_ESOLU|nr:probable G-protein coupled receptor 25 [Esox lucius]
MVTSSEYYYNDDNTTDMWLDFNESIDYFEDPISSMTYSHIYLPLFYFLIFFAGFVGNLFVMTVIGSGGKRGGRLVDTFVFNLALADLVFVFTLPLWAISSGQDGHWPFGNLLCKLSSYIIGVNRFSNIFFLTCMSVDRYLAVVRLMDSRFLRSSRCVRHSCAVVWLVSLSLGTLSLVYRNVKIHRDKPFCQDDEESSFFLGFSLSTIFLTFTLPVVIILFCYCSILSRLAGHSTSNTHSISNPRVKARRRHSLKMVFAIIIAFLVSWLPFNIFKAILIGFKLSGTNLSTETLTFLSHGLSLSCCLAFLNSCVNPVIYLFLDHHFRRRANNLFLKFFGKGGLNQSNASSTDFYNCTSEGSGTTFSRNRLQSIDRTDK